MAKSTKEQLFEAWREWDLELANCDKNKSAKERFDQPTDLYRKEEKKGASRAITRFYLRKEYAAWRRENG